MDSHLPYLEDGVHHSRPESLDATTLLNKRMELSSAKKAINVKALISSIDDNESISSIQQQSQYSAVHHTVPRLKSSAAQSKDPQSAVQFNIGDGIGGKSIPTKANKGLEPPVVGKRTESREIVDNEERVMSMIKRLEESKKLLHDDIPLQPSLKARGDRSSSHDSIFDFD